MFPADADGFVVDFDCHHGDGRHEVVTLVPILHQHLESYQILGVLTQSNQQVDTCSLEDEPLAIKGLVVGGFNSCADPKNFGITILDSLLHPAFLLGATTRIPAHHLPRLHVTHTALGASEVTPKFLTKAMEETLKDAATFRGGDTGVGIKDKALVAHTGVHAGGGGGTAGRHSGDVAGGGAGEATGAVGAVGRASESWTGRETVVRVEQHMVGQTSLTIYTDILESPWSFWSLCGLPGPSNWTFWSLCGLPAQTF